ncbi:MAG: hypothetical protein LBV45_09910 [Xanthomonadaceae bacterium]|nr:hypothetical protein [Xanthomonadaceae bacterium]
MTKPIALASLERLTIVPLLIGLLVFPSFIYQVQLNDGAARYRGFPLPWDAQLLAASSQHVIHIAPLVVNILFYATVIVLIRYEFRRYAARIMDYQHAIFIHLAVWLYGLLAITYLAVMAATGDIGFEAGYPAPLRLAPIGFGPAL